MNPSTLRLTYVYIVANKRRIQSLIFCRFGKQFIIIDDVGIWNDVKECKYCMRGLVVFMHRQFKLLYQDILSSGDVNYILGRS